MWANTFGGLNFDIADDVKIASDGNIIVSGRIEKNATFADGEELGSTDSSFDNWYQVILKLDVQTGDIIWKTYTGYQVTWDYQMPDNNSVLIKSDGTIVSVVNYMQWNENSHLKILEVNSTNGSVTQVSNDDNSNYTFRSVYGVTLDNNDNIYVAGRYYEAWESTNSYERAKVRKYNSNYTIDWQFDIDGSNEDVIYDIAYDDINDLIYVTGKSLGANLNPLGEAYIGNYSDDQGDFFASYNTEGILQSAHIFANSSQNKAYNVSLNLVDNRLLISGVVRGYPDMDVTDSQFYPVENYPYQTGSTDFVSIYSLEGGLDLTGPVSYTHLTLPTILLV